MREPLTDRTIMTARPVGQALAAMLQKIRIQRLEALEHRDRHHEVAPRVAYEPFHFAFVVALAGAAEPIREQVV